MTPLLHDDGKKNSFFQVYDAKNPRSIFIRSVFSNSLLFVSILDSAKQNPYSVVGVIVESKLISLEDLTNILFEIQTKIIKYLGFTNDLKNQSAKMHS